METINDRMEMIVKCMFRGNNSEFAKTIGIPPSSTSNYMGGQRRSKPSSDLLAKIVMNIEVDAMWLLTGKGEMRRRPYADASTSEVINLCKQLVSCQRQKDETVNKMAELLERMN